MVRRWNSWGDTSKDYPLSINTLAFIESKIGKSKPLPDATFEEVVATVPKSRLPQNSPIPIAIEPETRVRYACGQSIPDWIAMRSGQFSAFPDGVAFPETSEEVRELLFWAKENDIHVMPYGGGTSVVGHVTLAKGSPSTLTVSMEKMNMLLDLNELTRLARFGTGVTGAFLEEQLSTYGYMLGHYPQSFEYSTLGGWIVTRSSGQQSLYYGRIEQLFAGGLLETFDGPMMIKPFPASAAGPDLREFVLGSEGRVGILTEAIVKISPKPEFEEFRVFVFPSWEQGVKTVRELVQSGLRLSMLRLSNAKETEVQLKLADHPILIGLLETWLKIQGASEGKCLLMVGFTGSKKSCRTMKETSLKLIRRHGGINLGSGLGDKWKKTRFKSPYLRESLWKAGYVVDTLETACQWQDVEIMVKGIELALEKEMEDVYAFTHLSHVYAQGSSVYTTYLFKVGTSYEETLDRWKRLKSAASKTIVSLGGTISHQHGVGKDHSPYLEKEKGHLGISAIRALCEHFDPDHLLATGNLIKENEKHVE